jgi:hypothetical protein
MIYVPAMAGLFRIGSLFSRSSAGSSSGRRWRRRGGISWRRLLHLSKFFRKR